MRKFLLSLFGWIVMTISNAQEFADFGKPSVEEKKLQNCSFDPDANVIVLLDQAVSTYNDDYNLITNRHVRIKILNEKGIDYATVGIPFYRHEDFEFISNVEGIITNVEPNGSFTSQPLEKKLIFTRNVTTLRGEVRFTFPSVKEGSILEYRYTSTMKYYTGLDDWYFQREIPVLLSKYMLYVPPRFEFTYQAYKRSDFELKTDLEIKEGRVKFEMRNIPGIGEEPYMDARKDYIQRVAFQLSGYLSASSNKLKYRTSWDQLSKELLGDSDIGGQLGKELSGTEDFIQIAKGRTSEFERMKLVFNYVRTNMDWNGYYSRHSPNGVKNAWNKKSGTSGDINLILVNLLRSCDIDASPMLVSERHNGKVNASYPFIDQFNTTYAAVSIAGKRYYLDARDEITPPQITPNDILNTTAFILNKKSGGLVTISDENCQYHDIITVIASVEPDEIIKGNTYLNSVDYARVRRLESYNSNNTKYIDENFRTQSSIQIDSFKIANEDTDSLPLQHSFQFSSLMEGTGDYKFIPLNLFSGFEKNPFISDKRFSEINFGYRRSVNISMFINIAPEFVIDELPKSIQLINPDKTVVLARELFRDDKTNKIAVRVKLEFKKSLYTVDEYSEIKEFYKKMFEILNEKIVVKKKSQP